MWLTILISFGFYLPVVLFADAVPMIGMLMILKTCAYVWTVLIGFNALKKNCFQQYKWQFHYRTRCVYMNKHAFLALCRVIFISAPVF